MRNTALESKDGDQPFLCHYTSWEQATAETIHDIQFVDYIKYFYDTIVSCLRWSNPQTVRVSKWVVSPPSYDHSH